MVPFPETKLIGSEFEQNAAKLMGWLQTSETLVIGVWGMGGVGKTALLKHIYHKLIRDNTFHWDVHWLTACESQCDDVYNWQVSIGKCFDLDLSNVVDEMKRMYKLYEAFAKKNIVLILDNVWQPIQTDKVGIPAGESGCKIILATRSLDVCRLMGCKDLVVKVNTLPLLESHALFVNKLENYDALREDVKGLAYQVVEKCKGLPLAIVTMASCMVGVVDINKWKYTLHELSSCEQSDMKEKVFRQLQYSFDRLNDEIVQQCFLNCIMYVHHGDRSLKYDVIDSWIKEGLLDDKARSYRGWRLSKGLDIMGKLVNLCLLREVDDDGIELHGLTRDATLHFMQKNHFYSMRISGVNHNREDPVDELWDEDLVRLSLCSSSIEQIPSGLSPKCPKLRVLDMSRNRFSEIPESFFVRMKALTVLDLSYTGIVTLPDRVTNLKNLRTLLLSYCEELAYVPSLTMLTKLRVLDLQHVLKIEAPMVLDNLKSLEMLKFSWIISDLTCFNGLMKSKAFSSCLEEYELQLYDGSNDGYKSTESSGAYKRVIGIAGVDFDDHKVILLPCNIEELLVKDCLIKSLGDALLSLNSLSLRHCAGMEYIFSASQQLPPIFPSPKDPQKLYINDLPYLRGVIKLQGNEVPHSACAFSNLRLLSICECPRMGSVFPIKLAQQSFSFTNLKTVSVRYCDGLEEIFESINNDAGAASNYNIVLPNLKVLDLYKLPRLGSIHWGQVYTSLKKLVIYRCQAMKVAFSLDMLQQLTIPNLKTIKLVGCAAMEVVFELPNNGGEILALPNLDCLSLKFLPNLESIYRGMLLCTSIRTIEIDYCPKYRGVGLSKPLICDKSPSTLASLPKYDPNGDFWGRLGQDYPDDALVLLGVVDAYWRSEPNWGFNFLMVHPTSSDPAVDVANQALLPPAEIWMNQSTTQDQAQTDLSLSAWAPVYIAGPEVRNRTPNVEPGIAFQERDGQSHQQG